MWFDVRGFRRSSKPAVGSVVSLGSLAGKGFELPQLPEACIPEGEMAHYISNVLDLGIVVSDMDSDKRLPMSAI